MNSPSAFRADLSRTARGMSLSNLALRGAGIAGKVALLPYLARYLTLEEIGVYGLVTSSVTLAGYLIGFDFYSYTTRELLREGSDRGAVLASQLAFFLIAYALVLPCLLLLFWFGLLPYSRIGTFYLLLVSSHLAQEAFRLLIATGRPTFAYVISFLSSGVWAFPAIALGLAVPALRTLDVVLYCWCAGAVVAAVLGCLALVRVPGLELRHARPDWGWIRRGIGVSATYFGVSLSMRLIELTDRHWLKLFWGDAVVGVYTLFASAARLLHELVVAGFVAATYPPLLASYGRKDEAAVRTLLRRFRLELLLGTIVFGVGITAAMLALLGYLDRPPLWDGLAPFFVLLVGFALLNASLVPHYQLYATGRDRPLLEVSIGAAVLNMLASFALVPRFGLLGAAASTAGTFAVLTWLKYRKAAA